MVSFPAPFSNAGCATTTGCAEDAVDYGCVCFGRAIELLELAKVFRALLSNPTNLSKSLSSLFEDAEKIGTCVRSGGPPIRSVTIIITSVSIIVVKNINITVIDKGCWSFCC